MKKIILLLLLTSCFILGGCVKQEEYDEVKNSLTDTKKELDSLKSEKADLESKVTELESEIENLKAENEKLQPKTTSSDSDIPENAIENIDPEASEQTSTGDIVYRTDVTYDDLSRRPDDYTREFIELSGEVVQLIEGDEENELRVALNSNGYDDVILCGYDPSIVNERILEGDYITIKGVSAGIMQYESTLGGLISIPAVYAMEIIRQ